MGRRQPIAWGVGLLLVGCSATPSQPVRTIEIYQAWELQPGSTIANHKVVAGLGDVSIDLNGATVYTPFAGLVQPTPEGCVVFSTPEVPAYLFRLCGLSQTQLGELPQGSAIGSGQFLHFATLRKQTDGTWAMVEPARNILERLLQQP